MRQCKIGIGYDIHRLVEGRKLFLGGLEIPYIKGLLGHSDGDALLHAICDALLGAAGEGDIGEKFPDSEAKYLNVESSKLLKEVKRIIQEKGFKIDNVDTVVIAQEPILLPFKKQMEKMIAQILEISEELVNVKAKTNEGLDAVGRKEAISCYAAVLLAKEDR